MASKNKRNKGKNSFARNWSTIKDTVRGLKRFSFFNGSLRKKLKREMDSELKEVE